MDGPAGFPIRVRTPDRRGASVVVATSPDGERLTTACVLEKDGFDAETLERPALIALDRGWRIYVSCATPGSKHWRIDALDAIEPAGFSDAASHTVFPGDAHMGVKDPVIRRHLDVVPLGGGAHIAYYERPRADGSHELYVERFDA